MRDVLLAPGEGWITAIPAWRATGEERALALKTFEAARLLADLRRNGDRRSLTLLYRLATGFHPAAPTLLPDAARVAAVEAAITRGELLLLRVDVIGRAVGATPTSRSAQDQVIAAVARGGERLPFEGWSYRFTTTEGWWRRAPGIPDVPVRADEARELVARMAASLAQTPADRDAWRTLAAALTDPGRGPGVLMLRHEPPAPAPTARRDVPLETPSRLAARVAPLDWIEVQLEWDDGTPFDEDFLLTLPGGRTTQGPPDAGGVVRVDGLDSGDCKLTFPALFPAGSA